MINYVIEVFTTSVFTPSDLEMWLCKRSWKARDGHLDSYFKCSILTVLRLMSAVKSKERYKQYSTNSAGGMECLQKIDDKLDFLSFSCLHVIIIP